MRTLHIWKQPPLQLWRMIDTRRHQASRIIAQYLSSGVVICVAQNPKPYALISQPDVKTIVEAPSDLSQKQLSHQHEQ